MPVGFREEGTALDRRKNIRILEKEEIRLLLNTLKGRDRIAVSLGLCFGLRLCELFRLRWDEIDFAKGLLTVNRKKKDEKVLIPLPKVLIAELRNYAAISTGNRLFNDQSAGAYGKYFRALKRKLNRLLSGNITLMSLRHTFAVRLLLAGESIDFVRSVLRDTNNTVTEKYARIIHLRKSPDGLI